MSRELRYISPRTMKSTLRSHFVFNIASCRVSGSARREYRLFTFSRSRKLHSGKFVVDGNHDAAPSTRTAYANRVLRQRLICSYDTLYYNTHTIAFHR